MTMEQIKANEILGIGDYPVNPVFDLPLGINGAYYEIQQDEQEESGATDQNLMTDPAPALLPPNEITIVSQTVRTTSGGSQVVDVVVEVNDVDGATGYDIRVSKA